jgi:hypothetical protein
VILVSISEPSALCRMSLRTSIAEIRRPRRARLFRASATTLKFQASTFHSLRSFRSLPELEDFQLKPLGIGPDCCQPSGEDITTGVFFVNNILRLFKKKFSRVKKILSRRKKLVKIIAGAGKRLPSSRVKLCARAIGIRSFRSIL